MGATSILAKLAGLARRGAGLAVVAALLGLLASSGVLRPLDDGFAALRFAVVKRQASERVTVVQIDVPSLRAAQRWPWSRERFARAITNLQEAGADVVGFDVDFSAESSTAGDRALQQAIERNPGGVVLPTFVQTVDHSAGDARIVETSPLGALSREALLASVNVPVDSDGRVRRYQYGFGRQESYRPSMGAVLASAPHGATGSFTLDYGIQLGSIDRLSFEDVYNNNFDRRKVQGRAILIGATALELGDEFATPLKGTVRGVFLHALAVDSLNRGRALSSLNPALTFLIAVLVAAWLRPVRSGSTLAALSRRHFAVAVGILALPIALQAAAPISTDMGVIATAQIICLIWGTRVELRRREKAIVQAREAGLLHLAMHEPETELPNRRALLGELAPLVGDAGQSAVAVVAVGLDRYASLRGAVGYAQFNILMGEVAARLSQETPIPVAHLSTSVLGLILSAEVRAALVADIARLEALDAAYEVNGHPVDAFVRIGVAFAEESLTAERLLEQATIALDRARHLDRRVVLYDPDAFADPSLNLALMSEMRQGLKEGQLSLYYQPKVSAQTGRVVGVEALVRWRHPVRGFIPPDDFIGTAEETGNIRDFTEWTIQQALLDSVLMRSSGHDFPISVNVSGRLIADPAFRERVLALTGSRARDLCLEITETAVIENPTAATAAIACFKKAGFQISIDDYGVGLSSLSYLKMLDADELKVDKSLVVAVAENDRDRLILKSTIDLAHSLGMKVVAEGVETEDVRLALENLGCDAIQGYLVSRPVPLAELSTFLAVRSETSLATGRASRHALAPA